MDHRTHLSRCTIQENHSGKFCDREVMTMAPYPVCAMHVRHIYKFAADMIAANASHDDSLIYRALHERDEHNLAQIDDVTAIVASKTSKATRDSSVVYYVLIGAMVKIGTTVNLARRMADYPPDAELLVTEPGGYAKEHDRIREFIEYREARNEWFTPGPRLREHIEALIRDQAA